MKRQALIQHLRANGCTFFTTPLSNLEIVIGKLGGSVLQLLCFVLSGVPVLALAMLLGGIAPRALVSLTAITLSTVLFVTMVSLAVSAATAKARDAVIRAYLVFFCFFLGIVFSLLSIAVLAAFTSALGVVYSLNCKTTLRAIGASLGTVVMLGGGYLACCCPMFAGTSNTREAMEIMMAPCMPFLLAWPGIASVMLFTEHGSNPEVGGLMTACILGTIGYAVAAVVLTVSAIEQFDEKSGRIQRGSGHSLHVRNSPPSGQPVRPNHKSA